MSKPQYHVAAWLEKYGWEEGKGLGKNLDGDADYIHVSKKDDTLGLGKGNYDLLDFSHWDKIYNDAAKKITISVGAEGAQISKQEPVEKKTVVYGSFVKAVQPDPSIVDESDLFSRCGGSTLRSFSQEGKMKRLEDCEKRAGLYDPMSNYFHEEAESKAESSVKAQVATDAEGSQQRHKKRKRSERKKDKDEKKEKKKEKKSKHKKKKVEKFEKGEALVV